MLFLRNSLILSSILLTSSFVFANICISDLSEFEAKKGNLPGFAKKLPFFLTADNFFVSAGIQIRFSNDKIKLESHVQTGGQLQKEDFYIDKICFSANNIAITLENKKTYDIGIKDDSLFSVQGVSFKKTNLTEYTQFIKTLNEPYSVKNPSISNSKSDAGAQ